MTTSQLTEHSTMLKEAELKAAGMNDRQVKKLLWLINFHCTEGSYHYDPVKWMARRMVHRFAVTMIGKSAFIVVECKLIGENPNSMQTIFCRETWTGMVGPLGGLKPLDHSKHGTKSDAARSPEIYGWNSI